MNILYISSKKRWGGVISWMENTSRALNKKGHNIWIITHPSSKYTSHVVGRDRIIVKKLGAEYNPISIVYLVWFIKKKNINIVVTNLEKEVGIGGIAAKICRIPNIRRVGREDDFFNRFKTKWNHEHLVTKSIVPCDDIKEKAKLRAPWLNTDNFTTIYNGRDPQSFTNTEVSNVRAAWGMGKNETVIGITAQLIKVKQVDKLIHVFKDLANGNNAVRLVISGEGREIENLKKLAMSLNLEKKVVFPGFTSNPILTAAGYDIAVLNSKNEGFPNSIVEYFAASKAVVSTNVGGVAEIIEDGVNGFLTKEGDNRDLLLKLKQLVENKNLRDMFSKNAGETLIKKFTEKQMIDHLESYFLQTIKK